MHSGKASQNKIVLHSGKNSGLKDQRQKSLHINKQKPQENSLHSGKQKAKQFAQRQTRSLTKIVSHSDKTKGQKLCTFLLELTFIHRNFSYSNDLHNTIKQLFKIKMIFLLSYRINKLLLPKYESDNEF